MRTKRRRVALIVLALLPLLGYGLFWMRRATAPQVFGVSVLSVETREKVLALTFDDGPNPDTTERILALLVQYDAKATFFMIGQNAEAHPALVTAVYTAGHELGNHSWSHQALIYRSPAFVRQEIDATDSLLRELGYTGTIHFRAPYGHKMFVLPYILMQSDRKHILWSIELNDWDSPAPEEMLRVFDEQARPGAILLLHDGYTGEPQPRDATVALTELILQRYSALGYQFVTVGELLSYTQ